MKKLWTMVICLGVMIFGMAGVGSADLVTFNFDALNPGAGATSIGNYMTGIYGAPVTVSAVGKPEAEGPGLLYNYLGDRYIESEPGSLINPLPHVIDITFSTPITSVSFDWGMYLDAFNAYADGTLFFDQDYRVLRTGHLDTYTFAAPVLNLRFTDGGSGEVGIDNLVVDRAAAVPEPGTLILLGCGLIGIGVFRRISKRS
jgi:hypothetical protein